jgi:hypothetical protein
MKFTLRLPKITVSHYAQFALFTLFLYSALMKSWYPMKFRIELARSPLVPEILILPISYFLPTIEFIVCMCLLIEKTRKTGAYIALSLMTAFTLYLLILVSFPYHENIPCACGGILGGMSYPVHIAFNIFFTLVALVGIYTSENNSKHSTLSTQQTA